MGWISRVPWDDCASPYQCGGGITPRYLLVPLYCWLELPTLKDSASNNDFSAFDLDLLSSTTFTRNTQYLRMLYDSSTLPSIVSGYFNAVMINSLTTYQVAGGTYEDYLAFFVGNTSTTQEHSISEVHGVGAWVNGSGTMPDRMKFTPDQETAKNVLSIVSDTIYKYNEFYIYYIDSSENPGAAGTDEIFNIMHGLLVQLPPKIRVQSNISNNLEQSVTIGNLGQWLPSALVNRSNKRGVSLGFGDLNSDEVDLLRHLHEVTRGVVPCWYIPDIDNSSSWNFTTIGDPNITEVNSGAFDVSINLEAV